MEFDKSINIEEKENLEGVIEIRNLISKYIVHWKWFIIALIISFSIAYYQLNFIRPQYRAVATIMIEEPNSGDNSRLSAFQDLSVMTGPNANLENEIQILKSKSLAAEVIKSLKLNVEYFTDKNKLSDFMDSNLGFNTEFYETENYINPPLKINFFLSDSALYETTAKFIVEIHSSNNFTITDIDKTFYKRHSFGEKINTNFGEIIVTPNVDLKNNSLIGSSVLVSVSNLKSAARRFANKIIISPNSESSNVITLSINDGVKEKAVDYLNELVNKYNERSIYLKEQLSRSTSDFVNRRLEIISNELSTVDLTAESLKTRYGLSDVASETGLNMERGQNLEGQIVQVNTELQQINYVKDFVSTKESDEFIPVDVGIRDSNLETTFQQYNSLMMEKKRLLENSTDKNPIVVNINEQLKRLKDNIDQGLNNLESSYKITLDGLNKQDARINSRLYSAPKQERQIRDVQRQQQIKETLYLYLLQKREETAITLGVVDPNAKSIDLAESERNPVSPNKSIFYFGAFFIGLLIPFVIIYIIDLLDTKVKNRENVENILNIPILGDIPKLESNKPYLIAKEDNSSVAEAFRIIRTNLSFILTRSDKKGKIIFITSTIAHEGKSFIASNISASLGHAGKKTLLIGMDIRAPKLKQYLGIKGNIGVTNYIINSNLSLTDIVLKVPKVENLDLISSGDLAPNPSELLMSPRVKDLFDEVRELYDYIIVDTAASSIITDTMLLRSYADAFIYVIRADVLDKRQLKYVNSIYKNNRFPNLALLVNSVDHKKAGYGYGYGYGYDHDKSKKKAWWQFNS